MVAKLKLKGFTFGYLLSENHLDHHLLYIFWVGLTHPKQVWDGMEQPTSSKTLKKCKMMEEY